MSIVDNDIALEDPKMFTVTLQSTDEGIVGGNSAFLGSIQVTINDNDSK